MDPITAVVATVEADHTIKAPDHFPVGGQVMLVPLPSITSLLNDANRRSRYAATRLAVRNAIEAGYPHQSLSNRDFVTLVKRARKATTSQ
jgi:hypothetical protein